MLLPLFSLLLLLRLQSTMERSKTVQEEPLLLALPFDRYNTHSVHTQIYVYDTVRCTAAVAVVKKKRYTTISDSIR
jgi:hypothetical protein